MRPTVVRLAVPAALLTLALAGCAPAPIYKPTANNVAVPPSQVARQPERYGTSDVIWGGRIVQVRNFADHSEIEILAYPLDGSQRPQSNDTGNGRFIAAMPGYVESLDYPAGGLVTVAGRINGTRASNVGQASYTFPLVTVNQSHVWTAKEMSGGHPNVSFGVGVGVIR